MSRLPTLSRKVAVPSSLPGALVLSLDFELFWGVRDHVGPDDRYVDNLRGERAAIDAMLALFAERRLACTWATVGMLFATDTEDLRRFSPDVRPAYADAALDPYAESPSDGELHFARDVISKLVAAPRQELATHTFSHFYCLEDGQDERAFRADIDAARAIAARDGVDLRSIVFPRNQVNPEYLDVLQQSGITAYRGVQPGWTYRPAPRDPQLRRAARLLDAYLPWQGHHLVGWDEMRDGGGLACVRASLFLRPWSARLRRLEALRRWRLRQAVRAAARQRKVLHLWWHPHNFGLDLDANMRTLTAIADEFSACRDRYGMESMTMAEVAKRVL